MILRADLVLGLELSLAQRDAAALLQILLVQVLKEVSLLEDSFYDVGSRDFLRDVLHLPLDHFRYFLLGLSLELWVLLLQSCHNVRGLLYKIIWGQ